MSSAFRVNPFLEATQASELISGNECWTMGHLLVTLWAMTVGHVDERLCEIHVWAV